MRGELYAFYAPLKPDPFINRFKQAFSVDRRVAHWAIRVSLLFSRSRAGHSARLVDKPETMPSWLCLAIEQVALNSKLGLIAGNGRFPFLVLDAARAQGVAW